MRKQESPEKTQWQDLFRQIRTLATALYYFASFVLIILEIIKLCGDLAR